MSDNFNPYSEWLGISESVTSPNHYQLLDIDKSVTDQAAIASAADRAMTRVRACKPGANAPAWAALLDRISEAKETLTDSDKRSAYDQQLANPSAASPSATGPAAVDPNLLPPGQVAPAGVPVAQAAPQLATPAAAASQAIDPMAPMAPYGVAPTPLAAQPVAPQVLQPNSPAPVPQAVPYLQPATAAPQSGVPVAPTAGAPNPMAPVAAAVPMAAAVPTAPQAAANPMAPIAQAIPVQAAPAPTASPIPLAPMQPTAAPVATPTPASAAPIAVPQAAPVAAPMLAAQPAPIAQNPSVGAAPRLGGKSSATAKARSKSGGLLVPILLGGGVGGVILVVVGVIFSLSGSKPKDDPQLASNKPSPGPVVVDESPSTIPRRLDEIPESERPKPQEFKLANSDPDPVSMTPADTDSTFPSPTMENSSSEPMEVTSPEPMTPMAASTSEPVPSAAELRELAKSMTTARTAIGELNFAVADREIAAALKVAKLEKHQAKVTRLMLLRNYVGRFMEAIEESLGRVNAGDQISITDDRSFGIVEKSPELLIIRMNGKNYRYPMTELPAGLANRLAEMSLNKDAPETAAMKATFVSINPKVDDAALEKAKEWWDAAADLQDTPDLITAINDDYSLKSDMMDVPLDPGAMQALAARADRLKDATTIEAFAKEYQSIIDESIKTLEPGMELSVGGSTVVTIKELKPDRIMLTVADETRGFPFSKLPLGLAASLAERIVPRDVPLSMVMKGAYFAQRDKGQSTKQFQAIVFDWWKQAGEMDTQLQPKIRELGKQYAG